MNNAVTDTAELEFGLENKEELRGNAAKKGEGGFFDKLLRFFSNKWTRRGFALISVGYLAFLAWVSWLTFAYYLVYDNAVSLFILYCFVNVLFAAVMIYTRKNAVTKLCVLLMHPLIIVMLVYGFGDLYLLLPPFIAATVIFFASGMNESLKVILGTTYMILIVLAILTYITLSRLTIPIPAKMDNALRQEPNVGIAYNAAAHDFSDNNGQPPFRLVAYVNTQRQNPTVTFYVERTDLDRDYGNFTAQRTFGSVRAGAIGYTRDYDGQQTVIWEIPHVIEWTAPNKLMLDRRLLEIDENGEFIAGDIIEEQDNTPALRPPPSIDEITATA
ncbi:MAG: hypothetical protein FWD35_06215 [Oscillospiraceae bacterium]|nr:hypothetical protein [Oscillospiraceae bacterium]